MLKDNYSFVVPETGSGGSAASSGSAAPSGFSSFLVNVLPASSSAPEPEESGSETTGLLSWVPFRKGTGSRGTSTTDAPATDPLCGSLSYPQRLVLFVMCSGGGVVMLGMSMMYIMQIFIGRPEKFAMTYTLANLMILGSSCFLVGPAQQLRNMFGRERGIASIIYVVSMLGTMYSAWRIRSFFVVVPMLTVQFTSLLWYVASYVPYGRDCLSGVSGRIFRKTMLPI